MVRFAWSVAAALLASVDVVFGLGSTCTTALGAGNATSGSAYWLQNLTARGKSAFNGDSTYVVRRNVKDYGAKGDGVTDDTAAINSAMSSGGRCGNGCGQSSLYPAVVYFPAGTYLISTPIINYWYTAMIGDGRNWPSIKASANFSGIALIDADPYLSSGQYYVNQNNFYRSLRNFVIDMQSLPVASTVNGLHWQVSQATSIAGLKILMSTSASTGQVGMFMENGSGGFMGDITINGGATGLNLGNQQFTVRNVTITNAQVGIYVNWSWTWLFYRITMSNCKIGFKLNTGSTTSAQTTGSTVIADSSFTSVTTAIQTTTNQPSSYNSGFALDNIAFSSVTTGVADTSGNVALAGGSTTVTQWVQGSVYSGTSSTYTYTRGSTSAFTKPTSLTESGKIVSRPRPQYETYDVSQFVSVKALGAKGDGSTDDTATLTSIFSQYAGCKIIFFDHGTYMVSSTLTIPAGTKIIGEAWSEIMGFGTNFQNASNPQVVVKVGASTGASGVVEVTDMLFTTRGPAAGAIVVEWNVADPSGTQGGSGTWDTLIRIGGAAGTNLLSSNCVHGTINTACMSAFLGLHITSGATGYFEGLWVWTADHDIETGNTSTQISIFTGRGILTESAGPVWLIGTGSEHAVMVQYNLYNAKNHFIGVAQTESPYYQPSPTPPSPFSTNSVYHDPTSYPTPGDAWAMTIQNSTGILIYGAGFYSFFNNYANSDTCPSAENCQNAIFNIDSTSSVSLLGLSTVGVSNMLSVSNSAIIPNGPNLFGTQATVMRYTK